MNFKSKALFLFGVLLFGIVLSYFLGGSFMEGLTTASTTPTTTSTTSSAATPETTSTTPETTSTTPETTSTTPETTSTTPVTATSSKPYDNYNHYKDDITSTQYYGSTGTPIIPSRKDDKEIPEPNNSANNSAKNSKSKDYGTQYYSTLPPGIPASQIMPGDEDLYILKSEIVPPVCPVCPAFPSASLVDPPPPCPPCGRCPEASFDCKKVPNYSAMNSDTMPMPVLNDFSSFGM